MGRLTVFAKGNSDLVESLFGCRDALATWSGLNEHLRAHHPGWRVRLRHETLIRSDALLAASGTVPPDLDHLASDGFYPLASQFSAAFFDGAADVHVLSIQPDVTMKLLRHRASGQLFYPGLTTTLSAELRTWLQAECEVAPLLTPEQSLDNLAAIVERLRQGSRAPILVYNLSTVVPGDDTDNYHGLGETLTTRIKRFNLALVDLSTQCDVAVVDVDRLTARLGADRLKLDSVRLNCAGSRLVAEDVVRILDAHDCFVGG